MLQDEVKAVGDFLAQLASIPSETLSKKWLKYSDLPHEKIYYRQDEETKCHVNYIETQV